MPISSIKRSHLLFLFLIFLLVALICVIAPPLIISLAGVVTQPDIKIAEKLPAVENTVAFAKAVMFQDQPAPVEKPDWKSHTTVLARDGIRALAVDQNGAVWTVGSGGAVRWDVARQTYTRFTSEHGLFSSDLFSIAVAPDGAVWTGAETGGISTYDGKGWTSFQLPGTHAWHEEVHAIQINPDETMYAGVFSNGGLRKKAGGRWERISGDQGPGNEDIGVIYRASDGSDWIGVHGNDPADSVAGRGGIYHYDGQTWRHYEQKDGLVSNVILAITESPTGMIWAATPSGLAQFDGNKWINYTADSGLADSPVTAMIAGSDQAIWVATGQGLSRFDGTAWTHYNLGWVVTALAQGPDGMLWFGSNNGLHLLKNDTVFTYRTQDTLPGNVITTLAISDDGAVWCEMPLMGLVKVEGSQATRFTMKDGLADDLVLSIQPVGDAVWFGTDNGISRYENGQWTTFDPSNGTSKRYEVVFSDPRGRIWAAAGTNAWVFEQGNWTQVLHRDEKGLSGIRAITASADGSIWFALGEGVTRFDGKNWVEYTEKDGLPYQGVDSLVTARDGSVWAGTTFGQGRFDGQKWEVVAGAHNLNPIPGRMAAAKDGSIWIAGFGGVVQFDPQRRRQMYTSQDGLAGDRVWDVAQAPDGSIWFATSSGLSRFTP